MDVDDTHISSRQYPLRADFHWYRKVVNFMLQLKLLLSKICTWIMYKMHLVVKWSLRARRLRTSNYTCWPLGLVSFDGMNIYSRDSEPIIKKTSLMKIILVLYNLTALEGLSRTAWLLRERNRNVIENSMRLLVYYTSGRGSCTILILYWWRFEYDLTNFCFKTSDH